ncbi:MAG: hypothetical protein CR991_01175 [Proteobacteria bacterium]|nr:MAG: hypothetical protein CR991_01175 [Pseudomonadota bacterium]
MAVHSGSAHYGDEYVVVQLSETAGSNSSSSFAEYGEPGHVTLAQEQQIGAVWGLAHDRVRNRLLAGAFIKRFTRLARNPTTIFSVPVDEGVPSEWVTLDSGRSDPHASPDWGEDYAVIPAVGKEGLGDVDIAEDGREVYTIDLKTREFVRIPVNTDGSAGTPVKLALPVDDVPNCAKSNDVRPMGLGVNDGKVYIGMVCSAESTVSGLPIGGSDARKGNPAQLRGYVYAWDGATDFSLLLNFPLNYERGCLNHGGINKLMGMDNCNNFGKATWQAWTPVYPFNTKTTDAYGYPQPMIADIDFVDGDMVLGLLDRFGHMDGSHVNEPTDYTSGQLTIAGDILHACRTGADSWVMEKLISGNATCSTSGKGYDTNLTESIDEYYYQDDMGDVHPGNHADIGEGGIAVVPGSNQVISSVMDPARSAPKKDPVTQADPWESQGLHWYNSADGSWRKGYLIFDQGQPDDYPNWGKGNSLGDVELLVKPAPVEIGNRVWLDTDKDGIQDAGEPGIADVNVTLICGKDSETTTSSANGEYYFSNAAGGNAEFMDYGEECVVRVAAGQPELNDYELTQQNAGGDSSNHPATDLRDSDAADNAGTAEINFTVGHAGENNHTLDFGFTDSPKLADIELTKVIDKLSARRGEQVVYTLTATNKGPADATGVTVSDQLPTGVTPVAATPPLASQGSYDMASGVWNIGDLPNGLSVTLQITVTVD